MRTRTPMVALHYFLVNRWAKDNQWQFRSIASPRYLVATLEALGIMIQGGPAFREAPPGGRCKRDDIPLRIQRSDSLGLAFLRVLEIHSCSLASSPRIKVP